MSDATRRPSRSAEGRAGYRAFRTISTRWMDNDAYGHVNNVVYYSWFDTAVNAHLIEQGARTSTRGETIGLVIETQCNYFAPVAFPQLVEAGLRVARIGSSSVRYEVGLFLRTRAAHARPRATSCTSTSTAPRAVRRPCRTASVQAWRRRGWPRS